MLKRAVLAAVGCLGGGLFASLAAQSAPAWQWHPVPGANAVAVGLLWRHGYDDDRPDECGAARVLAECRLWRARALVPGVRASGLQMAADATVVFVVVDAAMTDSAVRFVQALLDDRLPIDDDTLAVACAEVALAADDAEFLYPGLVMQGRARLLLCQGRAGGRPVAGSAAAVQGLSPARVRELLQRPVAVRGAVLGAVSANFRTALQAVVLPTIVEAAAGASPPPAPARLPLPACETQHDRVNAPFVAAAFLVPEGPDLSAFAVAVEVARLRAQRRFKMRPNEATGRDTFVAWSWLQGDPVLVFCRRGMSPTKLLPGEKPRADANAERAATRAEVEALLADLRERAPTDEEVAAARSSLQFELALQPMTPALTSALASNGGALPGRLEVLLLAAHRGIDGSALAAVASPAVREVLQRVLQPAAACWCGLMPVPQANFAWRAR